MATAHLQVLGRVQGVGFRWFVRVQARRLALSGWVANLPDGSVEIAAKGDQANLDELRRQVSRGPDGAHVSEVRDLPPTDEELDSPFGVRKRG